LTTDDPNVWALAYRKTYGIDPNMSVQPVDLSFQIHRECLLAKTA
jgi:hypothetical protein